MYSEEDLRGAVASGAISAQAADALRAHVTSGRFTPATDEENFRLINSFNDIFVTIAAVLLLVAMAGIGQAFTPDIDGPPPFSGLLIAGTAWVLAELFTKKRRMALPSIVLLLAFVGGVFVTLIGFGIMALGGGDNIDPQGQTLALVIASASALLTAAATWVHWQRFKVPITVAAGAAAVAATVMTALGAAFGLANADNAQNVLLPMVFMGGLAIFAYAMRWDISDRARTTRRSDVAFWLHLLAAPMIAHPLFYWLGVTGGQDISPAGAVGVLCVYIAMGLVALMVDRRALLVSALAYVLVTLTSLFDRFGAVELNVALTALVIGSALLTLSAFWTPIRQALVRLLPGSMQQKLPLSGLAVAA